MFIGWQDAGCREVVECGDFGECARLVGEDREHGSGESCVYGSSIFGGLCGVVGCVRNVEWITDG